MSTATAEGAVSEPCIDRAYLASLLTSHQAYILSVSIAKRLKRITAKMPKSVAFEDLMGWAYLGIAKALDNFNPDLAGTRDFVRRFYGHLLTKGRLFAIDEMRRAKVICRVRNGRIYGRTICPGSIHDCSLPSPTQDDPAVIVAEKELHEHCLGKLSDRDRLIYQLRYEDQLSFAEIAEKVNLSTTRVFVLHERILESICDALTAEGIEIPKKDAPVLRAAA